MEIEILKIDQKKYIWYLLKAKKITICYATVLSIKAKLFITMNQAGNYDSVDYAVYQQFIINFIYLVCGT